MKNLLTPDNNKNKFKSSVGDNGNAEQIPECYNDLKHTEKTDNIGLAISQALCNILTQCWQTPFRKEEIIDVLQRAERPENATMLKPLEINTEVRKLMNKQDLQREQDMRYIGNVICAAGKNLAQLMDMLAHAEITCRTKQT